MGKNKKKRAKGTGSNSASQESDLRLVARGSGAAGGEVSLALVKRGGIGAEMMSGGRLSMGAMSWVSSAQAEKEGYVGAMTYAETIAELRRENAQRVVSQESQASTENLYEAVTQHLAEWVAGVDCPKQQGAGQSRRNGPRNGFNQLEELGLFSDTKGNIQRELRERKLLMLAKDRTQTLSLQDVSEHNIFLINLRDKMNQRKEALTKRARLISVMLNKTRDARRLGALQNDMERIRIAEKNFNEDTSVFNAELLWFHSTPSFQKAQEHVAENWVNLGKGENGMYVQRHEIEEDEDLSFEEMLQQMKLEEAAGRIAHNAS